MNVYHFINLAASLYPNILRESSYNIMFEVRQCDTLQNLLVYVVSNE